MAKPGKRINYRRIAKYFDKSPQKIFRSAEVAEVFGQHWESWGLPQQLTKEHILGLLTRDPRFKRFVVPFPHRKEHRYAWGDVPLFEILLTLRPNSYFTHRTALRMHGLTEEVPNTIYLNHEQRPHCLDGGLEQSRIDAAFRRAQRLSKNTIDLDGRKVCLINGMHTCQLGVIEQLVEHDMNCPVRARLTNLERTLIDVTVRPAYAGGVEEVLRAYRLARERISVSQLVETLNKLAYVYPYHQAVGFYLEAAGYKPPSLDLLRELPMEFDFYLAHGMGRTRYVKDWRLHVPKDFTA